MKTFVYYFDNGMGWICDFGVVLAETKEAAVLQLINRNITFVKTKNLIEVQPNHSYVQSRS